MPTFYAPGKRTSARNGKTYANSAWVVRGRIDGKLYEKNTGAISRKDADSWWKDFEKQIWRSQLVEQQSDSYTFAEAARDYISAKQLMGRPLKEIEFIVSALGARNVRAITPQDIINGALTLYPTAQPQTRNRHVVRPALAVLHHAAANNRCDWLRVKSFTENDPDRPLMLPEDAHAAITAARAAGQHELAALLVTLIYQGWRISETLNIRREWIDFDKRELRRLVSKSKKWRRTPIGSVVLDEWNKLPEREDGKLFSFNDRQQIYYLIDSLGLPFHYRPHMSRRGFATALKKLGHDARDIADSGQWEDINSVQVYIAEDVERARRTVENLISSTAPAPSPPRLKIVG